MAQVVVGDIPGYTLEQRCLHAAGRPLQVVLSVGLVRDPATGEPLHFACHLQDATAHHGAVRRLSSIIACAREPFVGIDAAGHVTEWNAAAEATFGWNRRAALGRPLHALIIPDDNQTNYLDGLRELAVNAEGRLFLQPVEVTVRGRNGRQFPAELTIWRADDTVGEHYAFIRDISDRVRTEHETAEIRPATRRIGDRPTGYRRRRTQRR